MMSREKLLKNAEWAKSFDPGALAAKAEKQFSTESSELRPGINARGFFNALTVVNNSDADIGIDLDFMTDRRRVIPAHSAVPFTNMVPYQEFNVVNLSATAATLAEQVYVTVRYEKDVLRGSF